MINDIPEAVIAIDDQHRVIGWNAAAERIYGWSAEEVMGRQLNDFFQTRYYGTNRQEAISIALETGAWSGEVA
jgi:PAS domain S-box-containing protein